MSKFKIRQYGDRFKVFELRDVDGGYCWDDVKMFFQTKQEAEEYIRQRREGDGHDR